MPQFIAEFFLFFSNIPCIFAFFLIGILSDKRNIFYWGGLFCLISICINYVLKISFKVPLPAELHDGYAFPSGHMQMLTVFYGWLANHRLLRMHWFFPALVIGEAYGLVYFHYHTLLEAFAGFATGIFLLSMFNKIYFKTPFMRYICLIFLLSACLIYIHVFGFIQPHVFIAASLLFLFTIIGLPMTLIMRR
ncbi:MAG: hypothetical protein EBQ95_05725 [Gammaproteobacteria bacterium]|nr:hypothetical protein [Gammaproteobacteria bacterium]